MKTLISPSLLSCDFLNIETEVKHFEKATDMWFHLDIMDGHFVPNMTFGPPIIKDLYKITSHKLDAHFMVNNPQFYIEVMKDHHLHNFTFHIEAVKKENLIELIKECKQHYPSVGISLKPKTNIEDLTEEILSLLDLVLVMSVEPGFGGQSFMPIALDKITYLDQKRKECHFNYLIQVDGGINEQTGKLCRQAGVDNLVAGSYIFKCSPQNYINQIETLRD